MKVFLAVGNKALEKRISGIEGLTVMDSEDDLGTLIGLMEFARVDYLIINRLLDGKGDRLLEAAKCAVGQGIKVIMLVEGFEGYEEKKLVTTLVNEGVHSFLRISNLSEEKLIYEMAHYPEAFDFNLLKSEDIEAQPERIIEKVVHVGFKKKILTVWDNAEFGCELAYVAAKQTGYSVLLVDMDLLAPQADLHLNIRKYPENIKTQGIYTDSGFNIVMDALEKDIFTPGLMLEACVRKKGVKNLYILTGNYSLDNYEYFSSSSLKKLIEKAYQSFDITILLVNRSIYDEFAFIGLQKSDCNLIPVRADYGKLREFNRYLLFLRDKQQLPLEKSKFIAYEHEAGSDLDDRIIREATENQYLGRVRVSMTRRRYRNLKAVYAARMDRSTKNDYMEILAALDIVAARTLRDRLRDFLAALGRGFRRAGRRLKKLKGGARTHAGN